MNMKIGLGKANTKKMTSKKSSKKSSKKMSKRAARLHRRNMNKYKKTAYKHHKKSSKSSSKSHVRKSFSHKSVCQLILLAIHAYNKPCSFSQVKKLLIQKMKFKNLKEFQIKKAIKDLVALKCLKDVATKGSNDSIHRYIFTKKSLPTNKTLKRLRSTRKTQKNDKILRQKLRRLAHKTNRGGRTYEQVVKDYLDLKSSENGKYFNSIRGYLRKHNMKTNNWILSKVLERLRNKNVVELKNGKNFSTGKEIPSRKSSPAFLKE